MVPVVVLGPARGGAVVERCGGGVGGLLWVLRAACGGRRGKLAGVVVCRGGGRVVAWLSGELWRRVWAIS